MTLSRRIDALVSQQVAVWEEATRGGRVRPCIALASLPGAGGEALGRQVAAALGFGCFGREIADEVARRRGLPEELLHGLDERVRSGIDRFLTDAFAERRFTESDYLKEVARLVATLGRRGSAVIVGRGSAFLLPRGGALRVLVVAGPTARADRFAREQEIDAARAAEALREEDERRQAFVRHHFDARIDDPTRYDLVVNTETLGDETAAALVVEAYRRLFP